MEVTLSKPMGASMNGVTALKYFPTPLSADNKTSVVWPGLMNIVSV